MEPFNPISSTSPTTPDTDSAAADDARAEKRRDDRAQAFKQAMGTGAPSAAPGTPTPLQGKKAFAMPTGKPRAVAADESFLSPALMRLRAEGYPLADTTAKMPAVESEKPELPTTPTDSKSQAPRQSEIADPTKQVTESRAASERGRQGGDQKEMAKGKSDSSAPDPRLLAGPVLLPNATQNFQAAVDRATTRPAPPPGHICG
jgi:hypothetical protein